MSLRCDIGSGYLFGGDQPQVIDIVTTALDSDRAHVLRYGLVVNPFLFSIWDVFVRVCAWVASTPPVITLPPAGTHARETETKSRNPISHDTLPDSDWNVIERKLGLPKNSLIATPVEKRKSLAHLRTEEAARDLLASVRGRLPKDANPKALLDAAKKRMSIRTAAAGASAQQQKIAALPLLILTGWEEYQSALSRKLIEAASVLAGVPGLKKVVLTAGSESRMAYVEGTLLLMIAPSDRSQEGLPKTLDRIFSALNDAGGLRLFESHDADAIAERSLRLTEELVRPPIRDLQGRAVTSQYKHAGDAIQQLIDDPWQMGMTNEMGSTMSSYENRPVIQKYLTLFIADLPRTTNPAKVLDLGTGSFGLLIKVQALARRVGRPLRLLGLDRVDYSGSLPKSGIGYLKALMEAVPLE